MAMRFGGGIHVELAMRQRAQEGADWWRHGAAAFARRSVFVV